jgi:predicted transcriptional regulator
MTEKTNSNLTTMFDLYAAVKQLQTNIDRLAYSVNVEAQAKVDVLDEVLELIIKYSHDIVN